MKAIKWTCCFFIVLGVMFLGFDYYTRSLLREACVDWPLLNSELGNMISQYPMTSGGQPTKDIQALYSKIKISLSGLRDAQGKNKRDRLKEYLRAELENPVASIGPMSPTVKQALLDNQDAIEKITNLIITENILSLPLDLDIGFADPIPVSATWLRPINELLIASALASQSAGEMYSAWRYLKASSRLTEALFHHPFFISQVLGIVESKNILLAMRKMTVPAPEWALDWPKHDLVKRILTGYTAEAYIMMNITQKTSLEELLADTNEFRQKVGMELLEMEKTTKFICFLMGRQLLRFHVSEQIADSRRMIQQRSQEGLCVSQPSEIDGSSSPWYPGRKMLSDLISTKSLYRYWDNLYMLAVYKTGTQIILRTKEIRAESSENKWPRVPSVSADTCLEHSWSYQHKPDGSVIFSYDKSLPKGVSASMVKLEYIKYIGQRDE